MIEDTLFFIKFLLFKIINWHIYFSHITTRKHTEFRRRFRRTPRSSEICDGILTNFRPNPKKLSRRNSVGHFRRNSDEIWFVGIFRRLFDDIPIKNVTVVVVGNLSEYTDELPTTFRLTDITVTVVGIPSEFADEFPTNHVTVADKYIWPLYSRLRLKNTDGIPTDFFTSVGISSEIRWRAVSNFV